MATLSVMGSAFSEKEFRERGEGDIISSTPPLETERAPFESDMTFFEEDGLKTSLSSEEPQIKPSPEGQPTSSVAQQNEISNAKEKRTKRPRPTAGTIVPERMVINEEASPVLRKKGWAHAFASFIWSSFITIGIAAAFYAYSAQFDLRHFAPDLESIVRNHSDYHVSIKGPIRLSLPVFKPGLSLGNISITNKEGQSIVSAEDLRLGLRGRSLFEGGNRLNLFDVNLVRTKINMSEGEKTGSVLFQLSEAGDQLLDSLPGKAGTIGINALVLEDSHLSWANQGASAYTFPVERLEFSVQGPDLAISIAGEREAQDYHVAGLIKNFEGFSRGDSAQLTMSGEAGEAQLNLLGEIKKPGTGISHVQIHTEAKDTKVFTDLIDLNFAEGEGEFLASVDLMGDLALGLAGALTGHIGDNSYKGEINWVVGENPALDLALAIDRFDLKLLMPRGSETNVEPSDDVQDGTSTILAQQKWQGSFAVEAATLKWGQIPLGPGEFSLISEDNLLVATMAQSQPDSGQLTMSASFDQTDKGWFAFISEGRAYDVGVFDAASDTDEMVLDKQEGSASSALAYFDIDLEGAGLSNADIISGLSGHVDIALSRISISKGFLNNAPVFIGDTVRAASDESGLLSCFLASASFHEGRMSNRGFVLETSSMVTTGAGIVDFAADDIKFVLRPRPKDPRMLRDAVDIEIGGSVSDPIVKTNARDVSRGLSSSLTALAAIENGFKEASSLPCSSGLSGY